MPTGGTAGNRRPPTNRASQVDGFTTVLEGRNMLRRSATGLTALSLAAVFSTPALGAIQTFDSAPADWVGNGNTADGNNFGFSGTDNTGGASGAGEAGGTFSRSVGLHTYADTNIGGTLDLNTA